MQTDTIRHQRVNTVENLAVKEQDISLKSFWCRPKTELKKDWTLMRGSETQLQLNDNVDR